MKTSKFWNYVIESGGEQWKVRAGNYKQAIIAAWSKSGPIAPGLLTRFKPLGGKWNYIDTTQALRIAGYSVEKDPFTNWKKLRAREVPHAR